MDNVGKVRAYFTVEAAMVMPVVLSVVVFVIYMMLFQYDRCLMEQDLGALALKGVTLQERDKAVLARLLQEEAARLQRDKYLAWQLGDIHLSLEGNKVSVSQTGQLILLSEDIWRAQAAFEKRQPDPVFFIRSCKKLMGGK